MASALVPRVLTENPASESHTPRLRVAGRGRKPRLPDRNETPLLAPGSPVPCLRRAPRDPALTPSPRAARALAHGHALRGQNATAPHRVFRAPGWAALTSPVCAIGLLEGSRDSRKHSGERQAQRLAPAPRPPIPRAPCLLGGAGVPFPRWDTLPHGHPSGSKDVGPTWDQGLPRPPVLSPRKLLTPGNLGLPHHPPPCSVSPGALLPGLLRTPAFTLGTASK